MDDAGLPAEGSARVRRYVRYQYALAKAVLKRVAAGESLAAICREPFMPSRNTFRRWANERPTLGLRLERARREAGRMGTGGMTTYCPVVANEIYTRLCAGESLSAICRDRDMPANSTVNLWRRDVPEFAEAMRMARQAQAEAFCDTGWELAMGATPETAYLTHVRLGQLRWMAAVWSPRTHARLKPAEPEEAPETQRLILKHFRLEEREDGAMRVVTYQPDADRCVPVRVGEGPWSFPPGLMKKGRWPHGGAGALPAPETGPGAGLGAGLAAGPESGPGSEAAERPHDPEGWT